MPRKSLTLCGSHTGDQLLLGLVTVISALGLISSDPHRRSFIEKIKGAPQIGNIRPMTTQFADEWPPDDTEPVFNCPYCGSAERTVGYQNVRDWSFHCAPGEWTYWDCTNCNSLYLDPRPTVESIGAAYASYYTHGDAHPFNILKQVKLLLRNECLAKTMKASIEPRLHLSRIFDPILNFIAKRIHLPFDWTLLANLPKGTFMDVGCGDGRTVAWAKQLGWESMGIEIDPAAVNEARRKNLNVVEGTYKILLGLDQQFDCIVCSHVLEHVHQPLILLKILKMCLRPGGLLLLTLPNSMSALRRHFGADWRGLEAPRHISIPSEPYLLQLLEQRHFTVQSFADNQLPTAVESYRIRRRSLSTNSEDKRRSRALGIVPLSSPWGNDFIKFACLAPSITEIETQ